MSRAATVRAGALIAACGAAGLLVSAVTVAQASAAESAGTLEVAPTTGKNDDGMSLTTSGPCPDTATNIIVSVKGKGFPAEGQNVVGNSPVGTYPTAENGGLRVPLSETMQDYAATAGFTKLEGRYDFTVTCRTAFNPTSLADFTAPIWFTSDTDYTATDPGVPSTSPTASDTTTATPSNTVEPSDTSLPSDTATPSDSTEPTDTGEPTDSVSPSDTSAADGGATGGDSGDSGGSLDVSTDVNGGASGGGSGSGSLAATGVDAGALGAVSAALVLAGVLVVRRARAREDFDATTDTTNV
ncbi:hypothetical protein GCM10010121_023860 [Streptomyces brasiliensis]|uniref:LPXTG cell wall anchor domain-containing protein n=2 Tax=Streptomyces brasiliensis TaxID=1954 RepID=A0A917KJV4_9ACTN|nr:hypothetical protein GCM10010121_023860 [Streptomyces brasiliensis]